MASGTKGRNVRDVISTNGKITVSTLSLNLERVVHARVHKGLTVPYSKPLGSSTHPQTLLINRFIIVLSFTRWLSRIYDEIVCAFLVAVHSLSQDTHLRPFHSLSLRGFEVDRHHHLGGTAILVRDSVYSVSVPLHTTLQAVADRINLGALLRSRCHNLGQVKSSITALYTPVICLLHVKIVLSVPLQVDVRYHTLRVFYFLSVLLSHLHGVST
jgi:hypothetical protein